MEERAEKKYFSVLFSTFRYFSSPEFCLFALGKESYLIRNKTFLERNGHFSNEPADFWKESQTELKIRWKIIDWTIIIVEKVWWHRQK